MLLIVVNTKQKTKKNHENNRKLKVVFEENCLVLF